MITFQEVILRLQEYWNQQGCGILQPIDIEVGAGTSHTATFLRALGPEPWRAAYVQQLPSEGCPVRRKPQSPASASSVSGGFKAGSRQYRGFVFGFTSGPRNRYARQ